ncbi:MAG: lytic murein transglycosylase B [Thiomargarita sp.]|nr:lytic murein transglycosylase B [Thiomargarita sp.]
MMFKLLSILLLYSFNSQAVVISQEKFIDNMVEKHHFSKTNLTSLLKKAKVKKSILKAISRPAGKVKPWYEYQRIFIKPNRIKQGVKFWQQNLYTLEQAKKIYGVPIEIIVAIIGVETIYGRNTGNFRVIDALNTLAFHYPKRANFFRSELEHYLLLTSEEKLDPLLQKGSYAGAMGIGQFMPSSFRRYAIDFDGDGKRNIWTNNKDAIGSVANYFKEFGWQTGEAVIEPADIYPNIDLESLEFKPKYSIGELKRKKILYSANKPDDMKCLLFDLETKIGTSYWLGFKNYYVITRYNHSKKYAMAVYQLAQEIAKNYYK